MALESRANGKLSIAVRIDPELLRIQELIVHSGRVHIPAISFERAITSELIDLRTQRILWKEAFDLKYERLLIIQESVAQQIVKGLEVNLSPTEAEQMKADRPIDPLAYEYYLRGVDLYSRSDFPMAIKMLEKSTELNPKYSLTWAHLGRAYDATASFQLGGREQYQKAEAAYEKALSLQSAQNETRTVRFDGLIDACIVKRARSK